MHIYIYNLIYTDVYTYVIFRIHEVMLTDAYLRYTSQKYNNISIKLM